MKKEFLDFMNFRHACKEFDSTKKIPEDDFNFIMDVARLSPSSFGLEPWKFVVVQNKEYRDALLPVTWGGQKQLPTASHFIITLVYKGENIRYDSSHVEYMMGTIKNLDKDLKVAYKNRLENFQKNEYKLTDNEKSIIDWASKQTYIALGNMMTAASSIGIDSCPIEGFDPEGANEILKNTFGLDMDKYAISHMLALGYRKNPQPEKKRQELKEIIKYF